MLFWGLFFYSVFPRKSTYFSSFFFVFVTVHIHKTHANYKHWNVFSMLAKYSSYSHTFWFTVDLLGAGIILLPTFYSTQKSAHLSSIFLISFEVLFISKFSQQNLSRPTNTTVHLIRLSLVQQKCLLKFKTFVPVLYTVRTCHSVHVYRSKKIEEMQCMYM